MSPVGTPDPRLRPAVPEPTSYPGNRRPDAIIVNDPTQPPIGSNIKAVVEIKMKRDRWRNTQKPDYEEIAGHPSKLVEMNDKNCTCEDTDPPVLPQEQEQEEEEKDEEQKYVPDWVVPALEVVAVAALAVAAGAAIVAAAPEIAAGALIVAGATAVFSLFSTPKESPDGA